MLQAGEGGNIVFEPGQGKQVLIGGNALVRFLIIILKRMRSSRFDIS